MIPTRSKGKELQGSNVVRYGAVHHLYYTVNYRVGSTIPEKGISHLKFEAGWPFIPPSDSKSSLSYHL